MLTMSRQLARTAAHIAARWDPALFTPAMGDPVPCKVNLDLDAEMQPGGLEVQTWGTGATIEYLFSALGREANEGETFTVDADGTVYTVQDVDKNDGYFVTVNVK